MLSSFYHIFSILDVKKAKRKEIFSQPLCTSCINANIVNILSESTLLPHKLLRICIDIITNFVYHNELYMKPPADSGRDSIRRI